MNLDLAKTVDRTIGSLLSRTLAFAGRLRRMLVAAPEVDQVRTILLIKLWGMGNVVLLYPVIARIRETYPAARIVMLTLPENQTLAARHPSIDAVVTLPIGSWAGLLVGLPRTVLALRSERPDIVLDFEQFCHVSGILARLSGSAQTLGFRLPGMTRGVIYNLRVPYRENRHMGEVFGDIARAAGVPRFAFELASIPLDAADIAERDRLLADAVGSDIVVIHPGSGDNFPGRRWPLESYAALSRRILERCPDVCIVYTGNRAESELITRLRDALGTSELRRRTLALAGATTVGGLAAILKGSRLVLSNDTGPVHLAGAMGVPVYGFYGPNTPVLYGPLGEQARSFYLGLPCSPCITNSNGKTSACRMPVCMRGITVDQVWQEIEASGLLRIAPERTRAEEGVG